MTKHQLILLGSCFLSITAFTQQVKRDTLYNELDSVTVRSKLMNVGRLNDVEGTRIYAGKKNEVLYVQNMDANIAEKTPRQIFAKVPGVFVYDMDGTGNQVNIAVRGLDPHRGWEFNIRKNSIITNSDMYGYPASHYNMPMEAVDHIEMVRGTASLQYGAQFGGMMNYVTKQADTTKKISFETVNSAGSYGLLSTYNAISGRIGKLDYYAYYSNRTSSGYRDNSKTTSNAQAVALVYHFNPKLNLKAELGRSTYTYQIPGPLTDSMFYANPRMATRARNYFNPDIYIPSLTLDWKLSDRTQLTWVVSGVLGARNSVQYDKPANVPDSINPATLQYNNRQVDIDHFNSYTTEMRLLHSYMIGNISGVFTSGLQAINNDLHRQQLGKGTTGSDFDLTLVDNTWGRDLHFKTKNIAAFIENKFNLTPKWSVSPGLRWEHGQSNVSGTIVYYDPGDIPNSISHDFTLLGLNTQYTFSKNSNMYAGFSQAYRPVVFKDIIPASTYERVDKNLKDARGYTLEAGYRGSYGFFKWDVSVFHMLYNNRMGMLSEQDASGALYLYRTNIGNSRTNGLECFAEYSLQTGKKTFVNVFTSTALMKATYFDASIRSGDKNVSVNGNDVESTPNVITRSGLSVKSHRASLTLLYSYTAKSYADALNTVKPSASGSVGLVPAYGLLDINTSYRFSDMIMVRFNVNNLTNKQYFTKRPSFYPGPGVWSSDGRSVNVSIGVKI